MKKILIGGSKTGYNLYKFLTKLEIKCELYYFPNEYAQKKGIGQPFENWKGVKSSQNNQLIITSETSFNHLSKEDKDNLPLYYFLRDKTHFKEIAQAIGSQYIQELDKDNLHYPLALKPKDAMKKKVPFKFKKIETKEELNKWANYFEDCLIQPYLSDEKYAQVAIAGYFDGNATSLISVEQKNHYPKGISAFVNIVEGNGELKQHVASYLNKLGYKGFIEFEFKKTKEDGTYFLMDINPRPWGWFYYYLDSVQNFKNVILENKNVILKPRKAWVNTPRLVMAMLKGNFAHPKVVDVLSNKICYEPIFSKP